MRIFSTTTKKICNSIGVIIPKEVVKANRIKPNKEITLLIITDTRKQMKKIFGTLKTDKPTQQIIDEIDKELWGITR